MTEYWVTFYAVDFDGTYSRIAEKPMVRGTIGKQAQAYANKCGLKVNAMADSSTVATAYPEM